MIQGICQNVPVILLGMAIRSHPIEVELSFMQDLKRRRELDKLISDTNQTLRISQRMNSVHEYSWQSWPPLPELIFSEKSSLLSIDSESGAFGH